MGEPRELILKLGQKITDRIGVKVTVNDPEYWGLAGVVTDEMAEVALAMKVRVPDTAENIAKKCGKSVERTEELLKEMSVIGIIEYNWENADRHKQYILPMFVPGCAEFMVMNGKQVEEHPEVADFFEQMSRLPLEKVTPMVPPGGAGIGMHVIPVEKAIPAAQKSASVEHISYWLNKYKDKYAVGACSCRRQQRVRGEGTGEIEGELCIGVGDMADYLVETGKGRYIDIDEVMAILRRAEKNGFVHQITNIDGQDKIFAICNCAPGVCNALRTSQLFNTPNMSRSAYVASVDAASCVACGRCVEFCPTGAAKLGQKLCTKNGKVEYPRQELPDKVKWGPDKWDPDYRDNSKINCYDTGTSPCKTACPAHLPVQGYVKMAAQGRYMDALKLIKTENPFPAVCGAICNRRCEDACTRGKVDEAVAIDEIKKFIAAKELEADKRYIPETENHEGKFFEEKIAVIGGGPAGMEAAYVAAKRGHHVVLADRQDSLGGTVRIAAVPIAKQDLTQLIKYQAHKLEQAGVKVLLNTEVTLETIQKDYPDYEVILCAGATPVVPQFMTQFKDWMTADDVLYGRKFPGRKIVVIGGGSVGCETADYLAPVLNDRFPRNREITLIEMAHEIMEAESGPGRSLLVQRMMEKGIQILCDAKVEEVNHTVIKYTKDGKTHEITDADTLVLAMGYRPSNTLEEQLTSAGITCHVLGDCKKPGNIKDAVTEGYQTALNL